MAEESQENILGRGVHVKKGKAFAISGMKVRSIPKVIARMAGIKKDDSPEVRENKFKSTPVAEGIDEVEESQAKGRESAQAKEVQADQTKEGGSGN
jgi:hypothetical protein